MLIEEYRIVMPMKVAEYHIAQLFTVAEMSKQGTGGGEGVEILQNQPFEHIPLFGGRYTRGQYTHKIYYVKSKIPVWLRPFVPNNMCIVHEKAWNAFPYCYTELSSPDWDPENKKFCVSFETLHLDNDRGRTENALLLNKEELKMRNVITVDIADNETIVHKKDVLHADPSKYRSVKTGRGPLTGNWIETCKPVMCTYKVATIKLRTSFQGFVESRMNKEYLRVTTIAHRKAFCWIDRWYGMTLEQIRRLENQIKEELQHLRASGRVTDLAKSD